MYTIKMNSDKSLTCTVRKTIYQRENLVDKIQFLFPEKYGDLNIFDTTPILKYVDQANELHFETLAKDSELYKGFVRCILPVETELSRFAGNIVIRIVLMTGNDEVLKTGGHVLSIEADDTIQYSGDITEKIVSLQMKINEIESKQPDDLKITEDNVLHLVNGNGEKIGDGIHAGELDSCDCEEGVPVVDFSVVEPDDGLVDNVVEF